MPLVILIGASGSGKTTIARAIQHRNADVQVFSFDQIGVPSEEQMITEYGRVRAGSAPKQSNG